MYLHYSAYDLKRKKIIGNLYKAFVTIYLSLCMLVYVNMLYDVISCEKKKTRKKERKENDVCIFLHSFVERKLLLFKKKKKNSFLNNSKNLDRGNAIERLFKKSFVSS